jgi:hypothetical protein
MIETASIGNPRSRTCSQEGTLGPTCLGLIKVRIRMGALRKRSNWKRVHHLVQNPLTRPREPRRLQVAKLTVAVTAAIHFHLLAGGIHKDRAGNLLDHLRDPIRPDLPDHDLLRLHRGGVDTDLHHVHPDLLIQGNTRWFKIICLLEQEGALKPNPLIKYISFVGSKRIRCTL